MKTLSFILFLIAFCMECQNSNEYLNVDSSYPTIKLNKEIFLDYDFIVRNEGLNMPFFIKTCVNGEIIVYDVGNICFYIFDSDRNFITNFGRRGQGPGDLMRVNGIDVDSEGNIYALDIDNV